MEPTMMPACLPPATGAQPVTAGLSAGCPLVTVPPVAPWHAEPAPRSTLPVLCVPPPHGGTYVA